MIGQYDVKIRVFIGCVELTLQEWESEEGQKICEQYNLTEEERDYYKGILDSLAMAAYGRPFDDPRERMKNV